MAVVTASDLMMSQPMERSLAIYPVSWDLMGSDLLTCQSADQSQELWECSVLSGLSLDHMLYSYSPRSCAFNKLSMFFYSLGTVGPGFVHMSSYPRE